MNKQVSNCHAAFLYSYESTSPNSARCMKSTADVHMYKISIWFRTSYNLAKFLFVRPDLRTTCTSQVLFLLLSSLELDTRNLLSWCLQTDKESQKGEDKSADAKPSADEVILRAVSCFLTFQVKCLDIIPLGHKAGFSSGKRVLWLFPSDIQKYAAG